MKAGQIELYSGAPEIHLKVRYVTDKQPFGRIHVDGI